MKSKELLNLLIKEGCELIRQRGSHVRLKLGNFLTTIVVHGGSDELDPVTIRKIEKRFEPYLGEHWLGK